LISCDVNEGRFSFFLEDEELRLAFDIETLDVILQILGLFLNYDVLLEQIHLESFYHPVFEEVLLGHLNQVFVVAHFKLIVLVILLLDLLYQIEFLLLPEFYLHAQIGNFLILDPELL